MNEISPRDGDFSYAQYKNGFAKKTEMVIIEAVMGLNLGNVMGGAISQVIINIRPDLQVQA